MAKRNIVTSDERKPVLRSLWRGLARHCPNCGEGSIFSGYLKVEAHCAACGHNNAQYPADDAAPYFTIFIAGHILIPLLLITDRHWEAATSTIELAIFLPLTALLTLALLPFVKGGVIGVEYAMGVVREALPKGAPPRAP
jgi:uncharacterized protein (DUF983 family)